MPGTMKSSSSGTQFTGAMKTKSNVNKSVSTELFQQAIVFFTNQVKGVEKMQRGFVVFTEKSLKDVGAVSVRSEGSAVGILWHDFLFIFFQYFIGTVL